MKNKEISKKYFTIMKDMYNQAAVRCALGTTEPFGIEVGLHQGSPLRSIIIKADLDLYGFCLRCTFQAHVINILLK